MLIGGWPQTNSKITEGYILNTGESLLEFPTFPFEIYSQTGGLISKNTIMICGGYHTPDFLTNCYTLTDENGYFEQSASLHVPRLKSASVVTKNGLWITGGFHGWNENNTFLSSTEFVTPTQALMGPEMPYAITGHCIIKIDESTVILTGGRYCEKSDGSEIILGLL